MTVKRLAGRRDPGTWQLTEEALDLPLPLGIELFVLFFSKEGKGRLVLFRDVLGGVIK